MQFLTNENNSINSVTNTNLVSFNFILCGSGYGVVVKRWFGQLLAVVPENFTSLRISREAVNKGGCRVKRYSAFKTILFQILLTFKQHDHHQLNCNY